MSETELSLSQHEQAVKLHNRIMASAALAQQSLWEMCTSLKEMRDGKLYKQLGYQNFEDYCEAEVGMKHSNAYRYISVVERINPESFPPVGQIGIKKLSLLATLSSEQQIEVSEKVNLKETTYKDLKTEIDKLKNEQKNYEQLIEEMNAEKQRLEKELNTAKSKGNRKAVKELEEKIDTLKERNAFLMTKVDEAEKEAQKSRKSESKAFGRVSILETDNELYKKKIEQLEAENKKKGEDIISLESTIEELESRPVEVAVVDNSAEYEEKLKTALEAANQENRQHEAELEAKFREENEAIRKKLEEEKQIAVSEVRSDYEKRLSESAAAAPVDEDKLKFKVYLTSAYDTLSRLIDFTSQHKEPIYKEKIKQLLNNVLTNMEDKNE